MPEMTLMTAPLPPPKQIRFVNNQGQPPSKRRRINAAYVFPFLYPHHTTSMIMHVFIPYCKPCGRGDA